jgi:HK97 family phage major capsid protein
MPKTIKIPKALHRAATITQSGEGEARTFSMSISSDTPYKRYDWYADEEYWEVLDHSPGGVDEARLEAGLPILFNHDRDQHLARATKFENNGHKITVSGLVWSEAEFAQIKMRDAVNGSLPDTSVGYQIIDDGICVGAKDDLPVYKFKWAPYEASLVTVPADITVGCGRERGKPDEKEMLEIKILEQSLDVKTNSDHKDDNQPNKMKLTPAVEKYLEVDNGGNPTAGSSNAGEQKAVDVKAERNAGIAEYKAKCKKIDDWVEALPDPKWKAACVTIAAAHKALDANFDEFRTAALAAHEDAVMKKTKPVAQGRVEVVSDRPERGGLSIGSEFVRQKAFIECGGHLGKGQVIELETGINALGARGKANLAQRAGFTSADLSAINVQIQTGIIGLGIQRLTIMDLISPGTTGAAAVIYPQENTFGTVDGVAVSTTAGAGPKAGTVGERGVKPKWEPDLTTVTANVRKVAITTDVPDEFLADFPQAESFLNERMPYMVDNKTEEQILYGDGVGNNLKGIFTFAGVQTRAVVSSGTLGTDDWKIAKSLRQGLTDIDVGSHFMPDGFAFHPYDWETAQLLQDSTGRFLAGGPFYIPLTSGVFVELRTFWGKPVVITTAVAYGRPLAGAWKLGAQYFLREGMRLEMSNSNKDNFERNMITVRAEHRLAVACYRPPCFIEYTGFPARAA